MSAIPTPKMATSRRAAERAFSRMLTILVTSLFLVPAARAATPSSGTLSNVAPTVTWTGGVIGGANTDESTCQEGTTCETFTLTLAPGDYTGKRISVGIDWLVPANDYDLYVHANTLTGPIVGESTGGAPESTETAPVNIDPQVVTSPQTFVVHVVCFTVTPGDLYHGTAKLVAEPAPRVATYLSGTMRFSHNQTLLAPITTSNGEPSVRVDTKGNAYVSGIRGVPAGVDLWRFDLNPSSPTFDPNLLHPTYLGQPDAFAKGDSTGGADGGGDVDIATSFPTSPDSIPDVTIVSLASADISSAYSFDRGANFTLSPAVVPVPSDDRQWIESDGPNNVFLFYRGGVPGTSLFVAKSTDHGASYPMTNLVSPSGSTPGYIDVDHSNHDLYVSHTNSTTVFCGSSTDGGTTWKNNIVDNTTSHGNIFDPIKVGDDGTVYVVWSDVSNIYLASSTDHGITWSDKVRVNDNSVYKTNLLPWLECGSDGRVDVVWYGSTDTANDDNADWDVLFSQTLNAKAPNPTFYQQVISDHKIHGAGISEGGLLGSQNRNLLDYFQVALDPQGAAMIAFTDDHNDFDGNLYVTRQCDGTSLYATANGSGQVTPAADVAHPNPDPSQPQVSDYLHDAVSGLLEPIVTDNPYDILWIRYSCDEDPVSHEPAITATMKLSGLTAAPPGTNWRVNFTANAPAGLSDRGDQYYLEASTQGPTSFTFGTAVRAGDGSVSYTQQGNCTGVIDSVNSQVRLTVKLSQLVPFATHGPAIVPGSMLWGLRGSTFTSGANAIRDNTRGGGFWIVPSCNVNAVPPGAWAGPRVSDFRGNPVPNPTMSSSSVTFDVGKPQFVELSVFDVRGARVRTIQSGTMAAGTYTRAWDGQTDHFSKAAAGVYFYVLNTADGIKSRRVALVR
jgi:hypothetical protein